MITKIKNIICGICVICGFSACVDTVILPDNKTVDEDYDETLQTANQVQK